MSTLMKNDKTIAGLVSDGMKTVVDNTTLESMISTVSDDSKQVFFVSTIGTANLPSDFPSGSLFTYVEIEKKNSTLINIRLVTQTSIVPHVWQGYRINNVYTWTRLAELETVTGNLTAKSSFTVSEGNFTYSIRGNTCLVRLNGVAPSATGRDQLLCDSLPKAARMQTFGLLTDVDGHVLALAYVNGTGIVCNIHTLGLLFGSLMYQF